MPYIQINRDERLKIEALWKAGYSRKAIGEELVRPTTTISRELERNGDMRDSWYEAKKADKLRQSRRADVNRLMHLKLIPGSDLAIFVDKKLHGHWSPEQIAGRLEKIQKASKDKHSRRVSQERIYQWIYRERKDLIPLLRHSKKRRHRRKNGTKQREQRREEAKKRRIDTRPTEIETRKILGHWEGDTIVGQEKTTRLLTHVERKSRFTCADKTKSGTAKEIREKTIRRFKHIPKKKCRTMTYDNGVEFSDHQTTERDTGLKIFFAYPYHSWERGTNENTNGLLREFFPKGSAFKDVTQRDVDRAVRFLNTRPRKCLDYLTPEEVFYERGLTLN